MVSRPVDAHPDFDTEFHAKPIDTRRNIHPLLHEVLVAPDPTKLDFVSQLEEKRYYFVCEKNSEITVLTFEYQYFDKLYWLSCTCE